MKRPPVNQTIICVVAVAVWLAVTIMFIGLRPEHLLLGGLILAFFFAGGFTRRLLVAMLPFAIFGMSYDWMNLCPNYMVNPIDVEGLYNAEKSIFGIATAAGAVTPNEFFATHTSSVADFICGLFYLCWVPVPIFFGLWLYFKGEKRSYVHFALVFLLTNFIGFTVYYLHPAAPPWYVASHGFDAVIGTQGEVAGLGAFDRLVGIDIFHGIYTRNANVFAALPSLHSAYVLVALIYAMRSRVGVVWRVSLAVITAGIWFTAVYTRHHYIIDVLSGIACAFAGFALFEYVLMRIPAFSRFINRYVNYISAK